MSYRSDPVDWQYRTYGRPTRRHIPETSGFGLTWPLTVDETPCFGLGDLFVSDSKARIVPHLDALQRICGDCPARAQCLQWALDTDSDGVWAGTTRAQRRAMR